MYICKHACIYLFIILCIIQVYVQTCIYMCVCMHVHYIYMHIYICIVHIIMYVCMIARRHQSINVSSIWLDSFEQQSIWVRYSFPGHFVQYVCECVCMCVYVCVCMYVCVYTYVCMYVCVYVCMCAWVTLVLTDISCYQSPSRLFVFFQVRQIPDDFFLDSYPNTCDFLPEFFFDDLF